MDSKNDDEGTSEAASWDIKADGDPLDDEPDPDCKPLKSGLKQIQNEAMLGHLDGAE